MENLIDCSEILSQCMESHMEESQSLLFSMPINIAQWNEIILEKCQNKPNRYPRSAGKTRNRAKSVGRALIGRTLTRTSSSSSVRSFTQTGNSRQKSTSVIRNLLRNKKTLGGLAPRAGSGLLAKKGLFGKVGKYAVVGLAHGSQ